MDKGTLYFFTGLSGAGKTTIGGLFYRRLKAAKPNAVLLDGDMIRPVFCEEIGYTDADRLRGAQRVFRLSRMLTEQGIDVVYCGIAMYTAVRNWGRENIASYKEIYIKAKPETLLRRNQKGLYTSGKNVVGLDLPFDEPQNSDIVVENDIDEAPEAIVGRIENQLGLAAGPRSAKKRVITYGTFDLLHYGHINLLKRARELGDYLIVALSTDEFNRQVKQKDNYFSFARRKHLLESTRYVDLVIPEESWAQKIADIQRYNVNTFVMGDDWAGKFDFLKAYCNVVYLPRTPEISTTQIKEDLGR